MPVMMQSLRGNEDAANRLTTSDVIYSELQRIFMKCKGKEDRTKLLKVVVCYVTVVSPVSEKVCIIKTVNCIYCIGTFHIRYQIKPKSLDTLKLWLTPGKESVSCC
jgi:hypothetical protein